MSSAENQGAGKRQRQAWDQGKKAGVYQCTIKGSRPEQAHEIWPNCLYYNHDYWLYQYPISPVDRKYTQKGTVNQLFNQL